MSTRGHIYLKLKDESKGQVVKFKVTKLAGSYYKNKKNLLFPIPDLEIPKQAQYMCIYNHFDSYVNGGLGETLLKNYGAYDKVLNLLTMGDMHSVYPNGDTNSYQGYDGLVAPTHFISDETLIRKCKRNEKGELEYYNEPFLQEGDIPAENALQESYAYYFDGETWYVTHSYWDEHAEKYVQIGWLKLADVVASIKAGKMQEWN